MELKPQKKAFYVMRLVPGILFGFLVFVLLPAIIFGIGGFIGGLFFMGVIGGISLWWVHGMYAKQSYMMENHAVIQRSGTPFSDHENELLFSRVTHVSLRLPYIQHKLFGTGIVRVESAGSDESEVVFVEMDRPRELFAQVQKHMGQQGILLDTGELILEEKPHGLAIFFEVFRNFIVSILSILYIGGTEVAGGSLEFVLRQSFGIIILIGGSLVLIIIISQIFTFLDLRKRVYSIYRNAVTYSEGFLSKNYTIIPYQNLSDTEITQTFIDKIFGLYDVKVSGKGSSHEILFKNLANGQRVGTVLSELILVAKNREQGVVPASVSQHDSVDLDGAHTPQVGSVVMEIPSSDYVCDTRPDLLARCVVAVSLAIVLTLALSVVSLLGSLGAALPVTGGVLFLTLSILYSLWFVYTHTYSIMERGVAHRYNFLTKQEVDFSLDKVTGIVLYQSILQRWLGVATLEFWSYGAHSTIRFVDIRNYHEIFTKTKEKYHAVDEEALHTINPHYSIIEWIKSNILAVVITAVFYIIALLSVLWFGADVVAIGIGVVAAVAIIHALIVVVVVAYNYFYYRFSEISLQRSHVQARKGLIWKRYYFLPYTGIKDMLVQRYPFSDMGMVRLNVAGDVQVLQQKKSFGKQQQVSFLSHHFRLDFIDNLLMEDHLVDALLKQSVPTGRLPLDVSPEMDDAVISLSRESMANTLVSMIIALGFIGFPMVLFGAMFDLMVYALLGLFIVSCCIIASIVISTRMRYYTLRTNRVVAHSGIFYKKEISILYERINYINKHQRLLGKIFGNGNVTVHTVGGSQVEILVRNIPDYKELYDKLKARYE